MADADPDDARERQVPRRHRRGSEQQRCPPGPRHEPLDGRHGAQGLRVVGLAKKPKYLDDGISSGRVRQHGLLSAASRRGCFIKVGGAWMGLLARLRASGDELLFASMCDCVRLGGGFGPWLTGLSRDGCRSVPPELQ